jgi:hypothetical protein
MDLIGDLARKQELTYTCPSTHVHRLNPDATEGPFPQVFLAGLSWTSFPGEKCFSHKPDRPE